VDTDAIVRARRRRQALDALEAERDREAALRNQLHEVLTELEGARIDAVAFARMVPADAELVREILDPAQVAPEEEWLESGGESPAEAARLQREEGEEERSRLQQVIEECRRAQAALERYLEALGSSA
jgi:hypothetical protein